MTAEDSQLPVDRHHSQQQQQQQQEDEEQEEERVKGMRTQALHRTATEVPWADDTPAAEPLEGAGSPEGSFPGPRFTRAFDAISDWQAITGQEVDSLPLCAQDTRSINAPTGIWSWMTSLRRSSSASEVRPLTPQEQRALAAGHAQLGQRLQQLEMLLFDVQLAAGSDGLLLRETQQQLRLLQAYNARLEESCEYS
jgi:hypothetical protein